MTIVSIDLVPEAISFRVCATKAEEKEEKDKIVRFLVMEGKPRYHGTYKLTLIEFSSGGKKRDLPKRVSFTVRAKTNIACAEAEIAYLPEFTDTELGIAESEQIAVDVNISNEYFLDLWKIAHANPNAKLSVGASFQAPKTDVSGHVVTWDSDQIGGADNPLKAEQFWFNVDVPYGQSETGET